VLEIHTLHQLQDPETLRMVIESGESEHVEFKHKVPHPKLIAKEIAAIGNSGGGIILFGVSDRGEIVGIDEPDLFNQTVNTAFFKYCTGIPGISHGIVFLDDHSLGAIFLRPDSRKPIYVEHQIFSRLGNRVVLYADEISWETSRNAIDHEPVQLTLSQSTLDKFLQQASEDVFTRLLLLPIFRSLGFDSISQKGHWDKTLEFGQDLRSFKFCLPTGHYIYFAAQVKVGNIGYSPDRTDSIEKIAEQIRMSFNTRMTDWQTRSKHRPDHVFLISTGLIVEGARKYLEEQICENEMKILFWDRDLIVETCERKGLPDPIQRDIMKYLEAFVDSNDS